MKWCVEVVTILVVTLVSTQADYGEYYKVEPSNPCEGGEKMFCPPKWCPEDPSTLDCLDTNTIDCDDLADCFDDISLSAHFDCPDSSYFKCGGDWPSTIPLSQVCDGTSQCTDGSDEVADFCAACVVGCYNLNREKCTWSEEHDATECGGCLKGYVDVGKEKCVYYKGGLHKTHDKPLPIWLMPLLSGQKARDGIDGEKGEKGWKGYVGGTGPNGDAGETGDMGEQGDIGPMGNMGDQGADGGQGPPGDDGENGEPGMDSSGAISVYTIWGKANCPTTEGTQTLTQGRAASPYHNDEGGASNYMCLPNNPSFLTMTSGIVQSEVVGVRYATQNEPLQSVDGQAMPCAVCSTSQSVQVMIPGRALCPAVGPLGTGRTWTQEYRGYLMSAGDTDSNNLQKGDDNSHFRTKYICVADDAEGISSGTTSESAIYHVHVDCTRGASLECTDFLSGISGYTSEEQVTCAVCTLSPPPPTMG